MNGMEELLIVLSRCSGLTNHFDFSCEPYVYRDYSFQNQLAGKYGPWSKYNISHQAMELFSTVKHSYSNVINLPKEKIIDSHITLQLTFGPSFKNYLRVIPKHKNNDIVR
jgi:hypothetical protein